MSIESPSAMLATLTVELALAGIVIVAARLWQATVPREWKALRRKIERIVSEMESSGFPKPTQKMCQFLVAGEDHRFQIHPGVDPIALCRALWKTVFYGRRQGGSTIAMQLVRTVTKRRDRTYRRKLLEIVLAVRLTQHFGRGRLPPLYLWIAHYGWRMNNFHEACLRIGIDPLLASDLDAAMLVARLKYPEPRTLHRERMWRLQRRAAHLMLLGQSKKKHRPWNDIVCRPQ